MISTCLCIRSGSHNPFVWSSTTSIHLRPPFFIRGCYRRRGSSKTLHDHYIITGLLPLPLTHLSIAEKLLWQVSSPPSSSPRLFGFRFPSIYAEAHALSRRLVVVYILYVIYISNVFCHSLTCFFIPFSLARLILKSRKQKRSMVPERTCHRRFLFQSIKRKQREYFFLS